MNSAPFFYSGLSPRFTEYTSQGPHPALDTAQSRVGEQEPADHIAAQDIASSVATICPALLHTGVSINPDFDPRSGCSSGSVSAVLPAD